MTELGEVNLHLQWDVLNWSRAVQFWLDCGSARAIRGARALEIGARDGGLSLWLVRQGARRVVCSDLTGPSDEAVALHTRLGISDVVEYAAIDATSIGAQDEYDVVVFKSVLGGIGGVGGIDAQRTALRSMHRALKPGGVLLFAENLVASPLHRFLRERFVAWGEKWRYVTLDEVACCLEPFRMWECESLGCAAAIGRSEEQRRALGRLDAHVLESLVPDS